MPKGEYHRRVAMMPVPRVYKPLIEAEFEKLRCWSIVEVLDHILALYFGPLATTQSSAPTAGNPIAQTTTPIPTKEDKDGTKNHGAFVPYLRAR